MSPRLCGSRQVGSRSAPYTMEPPLTGGPEGPDDDVLFEPQPARRSATASTARPGRARWAVRGAGIAGGSFGRCGAADTTRAVMGSEAISAGLVNDGSVTMPERESS